MQDQEAMHFDKTWKVQNLNLAQFGDACAKAAEQPLHQSPVVLKVHVFAGNTPPHQADLSLLCTRAIELARDGGSPDTALGLLLTRTTSKDEGNYVQQVQAEAHIAFITASKFIATPDEVIKLLQHAQLHGVPEGVRGKSLLTACRCLDMVRSAFGVSQSWSDRWSKFIKTDLDIAPTAKLLRTLTLAVLGDKKTLTQLPLPHSGEKSALVDAFISYVSPYQKACELPLTTKDLRRVLGVGTGISRWHRADRPDDLKRVVDRLSFLNEFFDRQGIGGASSPCALVKPQEMLEPLWSCLDRIREQFCVDNFISSKSNFHKIAQQLHRYRCKFKSERNEVVTPDGRTSRELEKTLHELDLILRFIKQIQRTEWATGLPQPLARTAVGLFELGESLQKIESLKDLKWFAQRAVRTWHKWK